MAVSIKQLNPTYGFDHRSDFCDIYRFRKGSLVQRELSAKLTEGLTTPPPLLGTSPYTGEALVRCKTAHRTIRQGGRIEVRSYCSTNWN